MGDEVLTDLRVIIGFDDDLAGEVTRITNRIRGLLTNVHPALERALGPRLQQAAVRELLIRFGGPAGLRAAGRRRLLAVTKPRAPWTHTRIVDDIHAALERQTVTVTGTTAAEKALPQLAGPQLAGFASLHDPASRAHHDRKRAQGKRHNAALICLARRRTDVLHSMLRNGTLNEHRTPTTTPTTPAITAAAA